MSVRRGLLVRLMKRWALLAVTALALAACGGGGDGATTKGDIKFAEGVTSEPCPGSDHTDRGCVYLGILSDLTEGPFAALGPQITAGQEAFWDRVNDEGGIAGQFDVDVEKFTRDNKYNPEEHVAKFREVSSNALALAQSLGTPPTLAAIDLYEQQDVLAAPASWWSGWAFEDTILESGYNYGIEAMNGLDWAADEFGNPDKVMVVAFPGDYGGDGAAGVKAWATANGVTAETVQTQPNAQAGNQDAAVGAILKEKPDIVSLYTSPTETAEIVGKAVASGFEGEFVGSVPTWFPSLLESDAAPALKQKYRFVAPSGPWGSDTAAHRAMEQATRKPPDSDWFVAGWVWSYPLLAALQQAADDGELTREGLRSAIEKVTVDYEGALPERSFAGDPNETLVREALIAAPDERAPLGASVIENFFVGPTAEKFEFKKPFSTAG